MNKQKHATLRVPQGSPIAGDFDDDTDDEAQAPRTRRRVAGWTPDGATKAETGTATRTTDTGNIMMIIRAAAARAPEGGVHRRVLRRRAPAREYRQHDTRTGA